MSNRKMSKRPVSTEEIVRNMLYLSKEDGSMHPLLRRRKGVIYGSITSKNIDPGVSGTCLDSGSFELVYHNGTFGCSLSACELSE